MFFKQGFEQQLNIEQLAELNEFREKLAAALVAAGGRCVEQMRVPAAKFVRMATFLSICGTLALPNIACSTNIFDYIDQRPVPTPNTIFESSGGGLSGQEALAPNYMLHQQPLAEAASSEAVPQPTSIAPAWLTLAAMGNPNGDFADPHYHELIGKGSFDEAYQLAINHLLAGGYTLEQAEDRLKESVSLVLKGAGCSATIVDSFAQDNGTTVTFALTNMHCLSGTALTTTDVSITSLAPNPGTYQPVALTGIIDVTAIPVFDKQAINTDAVVIAVLHRGALPPEIKPATLGSNGNMPSGEYAHVTQGCLVGTYYDQVSYQRLPIAACAVPATAEREDVCVKSLSEELCGSVTSSIIDAPFPQGASGAGYSHGNSLTGLLNIGDNPTNERALELIEAAQRVNAKAGIIGIHQADIANAIAAACTNKSWKCSSH